MGPATELSEVEEGIIENWMIAMLHQDMLDGPNLLRKIYPTTEKVYKVPIPFKKCLVFPTSLNEKTKTPQQRRKFVPAVVSSKKYRDNYKREVNQNKTPKTTKKTVLSTTVVAEESSLESEIEVTYEEELDELGEAEQLTLVAGQYVIVKYENKCYPGEVLKPESEGAEIRTMVNAGVSVWKWSLKEDELYYYKDDIICIIQKLQAKNNRDHYSVPEMQKDE